jgi:hypothetical protein
MTYYSYGFVLSKIEYMRRTGLITKKDGGYGRNGGACPDWLVTEQKEEAKRQANRVVRRMVTSNIPHIAG